MIYGYARVSTRKQEKDGNSLDDQVSKLLSQGHCDKVIEEQFTGKSSDRPALNELLEILTDGDTFVVTKLDRFARSLLEGTSLIKNLLDKGVKINILNIGYIDNTPASKLIRNIFFSFAEFERELIIERTQEGKSLAKLKDGYKDGRPKKFNIHQINHAISLLNTMGGEYSYNQVSKITGISKSTLQREVKKKKQGSYSNTQI